MNSFRFIEKALDYEIRRQIKFLQAGGRITQETRLWNSEKGITESMRSKEEAHDYRYFPDPDLMPIEFDISWIDNINANMTELPDVKKERFINEWGIAEQDAYLLASERSTAEWFEESVKLGADPKVACNWIKGDFMKLLHEDSIHIDDSRIKPGDLVEMLGLIDKGIISGKIAKTVFEDMYKTGKKAGHIVDEKGLVQMSDESGIESIIDDILANNSDAVEKFKKGKNKLMGFFVGQVMKETKGKANPKIVNELLKKKLS